MANGEPDAAGFTAFIRGVMGISATHLPDGAPIINYALSASLATVYQSFACLGGTLPGAWTLYEMAVYNLGGDILINYAPDQAGEAYFADLRKEFGVYSFVAGVVSASYDQGTGQTITTPDWVKGLTIGDLQRLKTPYGRQYLAMAQDAGPLWGIS